MNAQNYTVVECAMTGAKVTFDHGRFKVHIFTTRGRKSESVNTFTNKGEALNWFNRYKGRSPAELAMK